MNNEWRVLINVSEPIFSFGLRVQFESWGFAGVETAYHYDLALQRLQEQQPSLVIIDEKLLQDQGWANFQAIVGLQGIPVILLSVKAKNKKSIEGIGKNKNYYYLSKPCQITDLKAAVESLLQTNILVA